MQRRWSILLLWLGHSWSTRPKRSWSWINSSMEWIVTSWVAANGYHRLKDVLCVAWSLAWSMRRRNITPIDVSLPLRHADERARSPDHERLVKGVLAKFGHQPHTSGREGRYWLPTPGLKRMMSADRREIKPSSRTSSVQL